MFRRAGEWRCSLEASSIPLMKALEEIYYDRPSVISDS
jgi:hypothetical protein